VGNIASDAASALRSSALVIKNTVGAFGLTAVLALCAAPFVETGLRYLLFKAASKLAAESDDGKLQKLIARFSEAFGLLVAVIGASAVMLFFTVFSFMKITSI
jgi:stage III sporulation protein AE